MWVSMVGCVLAVRRVDGGVLDRVGVQRLVHSNPGVLDRSVAAEVVAVLDDTRVDGEVVSFETLLPVPDDVVELPDDRAVFDWCARHWGTESKALRSSLLTSFDVKLEELLGFGVREAVAFRFITIDTPPARWVQLLSGSLPGCEVVLCWVSESMFDSGRVVFRDGVRVGKQESRSIQDARVVLSGFFNGQRGFDEIMKKGGV